MNGDFEFDSPKRRPEKSSRSLHVAIIGAAILLIAIVAFIAAFLVYVDTRNENRRKFNEMMRLADAIDGDIAIETIELEEMKKTAPAKVDDLKRMHNVSKTIDSLRRRRQQIISDANSLWPR
jgi:hypothetical protein